MACYKNIQDPFFDTFAHFYTSSPGHRRYRSNNTTFTIPNTDVLESSDVYKVRVQLPGVAKENVKINFEENTLTIETNKVKESNTDWEKVDETATEDNETLKEKDQSEKVEKPNKTDEYRTHLRQIPSKPYKKTVEFPTKVELENILAEYQNGLLTVTLPKVPKAHKTIQLV